tara:strand:+ start:406 stop:765 length:360 start_codon:yes stop_codon:yes gene_type:complete
MSSVDKEKNASSEKKITLLELSLSFVALITLAILCISFLLPELHLRCIEKVEVDRILSVNNSSHMGAELSVILENGENLDVFSDNLKVGDSVCTLSERYTVYDSGVEVVRQKINKPYVL